MAFPIGWQRCCPLVIQQSKVAADTLTNYPLLVTAACLPDEMVTTGDPYGARSDGGDIRFSADAAGLEQLACELVTWTQNANPALATAEIWVSVPSISGTIDTSIFVWYHNTSLFMAQPAANTDFGSEAVWDEWYQFVWHGAAGSTLLLTDSSGNGNTLTNTGSVTGTASGKIGGAGVFGGANYLSKASPTGVPNSGPMTVEAWVNLTNATTYRYAVASTVYGGSAASIASIACEITSRKPYVYLGSAARLATNAIAAATWNHIASVYATPYYDIFVNGARDASGSQAQVFGAAEVFIGCLDGPGSYWLGSIDEVRISNTTRSPGWLATQYANHNSPTTFTIAGDPYSPGAYANPGGFYGQAR